QPAAQSWIPSVGCPNEAALSVLQWGARPSCSFGLFIGFDVPAGQSTRVQRTLSLVVSPTGSCLSEAGEDAQQHARCDPCPSGHAALGRSGGVVFPGGGADERGAATPVADGGAFCHRGIGGLAVAVGATG